MTLLSYYPLNAAHIIGGEMTYVCDGPDAANPGNNYYVFTMKVYRDCAGGGASFDSAPGAFTNGTVSVYLGSSMVPFIPQIILPPPVITDIDPDESNPCVLVPPNVCVEEGIYVFELSLPVDAGETYHVVYQRCCRNNSITNIFSPGESGATYTVDITPTAQLECNNSPVFNEFPPVVICVNEPLVFDHSATDSDGDQLIYSFCSPLMGGSTTNVAPNPDEPPPYATVQFIPPDYSALAPLGGDPLVTIDPSTGLITGTPTIQGQFVVGICVQEFRNGELISEIQRDFQFNVAFCEPVINANISEGIQAGDSFTYTSCGDTTFTFINQSTDESFIDSYLWSFDVNTTNPLTFDSRDVTMTFPGAGAYSGTMIVNPGTQCTDTANINVFISEPIETDFMFEYDTCVAGPVTFTDLSAQGTFPLEEWFWEFGDGDTSSAIDPIHEYEEPGDWPVQLTVTDSLGCVGTTQGIVTWFPVPPVIIVEPSSFVGCPPAELEFRNLSTPVDSTYDIVWDFGDGNGTTAISPFHVYTEPGLYDVSVEITSPIGCFTSRTFPRWIDIDSLPIADFEFPPDDYSNFNPTVTFTDKSIRAVEWDWFFDEYGSTIAQNPEFTFPDTGMMEVELVVTHVYGCQDSITKIVDVEPQITYFLPNAFTPNDDSVNEFFRAAGFFRGIRDYDLKIVSRWGEIVFATSNPSEGWNGRKDNVGKRLPNGVYPYVINFVGPRGQPHQYTGFATLIR